MTDSFNSTGTIVGELDPPASDIDGHEPVQGIPFIGVRRPWRGRGGDLVQGVVGRSVVGGRHLFSQAIAGGVVGVGKYAGEAPVGGDGGGAQLIDGVVAECVRSRRLRARLLRPGHNAVCGHVAAVKKLRDRRLLLSMSDPLDQQILELVSVGPLFALAVGKKPGGQPGRTSVVGIGERAQRVAYARQPSS